MNEDDYRQQLSELRDKLNKLMEDKDKIDPKELLELSRLVDLLINKYYEIGQKPSRKPYHTS